MKQKTIELLRNVLDSEPHNWELRLHIAGLHLELGETEAAAHLIEMAGDRPGDEASCLQAAEILSGVRGDAALVWLAEILAANRSCARAYLLKARILAARGLTAEALKHYSVATVIDATLEDAAFEAALRSPGPSTPAPPPAGASGPDRPAPPEDPDFPDAESERAIEALLQETMGAPPQGQAPAHAEPDSTSLPTISFASVGGMERLKERMRMAIVYPLKNRELFAKFKSRSGGGVLLYGPPGCGKTLISRAAAGESGASFHSISIHEILSKWIGESEQRLHQIFEVARRRTPAIVFLDEIDALGVKRSDAGHSASLVNTLLTEIDGATSNNQDLLVLGATNTPWRIDPAFRRPGRFDHVLFVPPPDEPARAAIFQLALDGIPCESPDIPKLAKAAHRFSGADIHAVVRRASEGVLKSIMSTGQEQPIRMRDLLEAIKITRPTTLEWLEQAANYASYQNQSGLYDDLAEYLRNHA